MNDWLLIFTRFIWVLLFDILAFKGTFFFFVVFIFAVLILKCLSFSPKFVVTNIYKITFVGVYLLLFTFKKGGEDLL